MKNIIPNSDKHLSVRNRNLENGLILVHAEGSLYGCINRVGDIVIPIQYSRLSYSEGLFIAVIYDDATKSYKKGVLNLLNDEVVPFENCYSDIKIENGLILYRIGGLWGAYTIYGKKICEAKYSHIKPITDIMIKVGIVDNFLSNNTYWGLINIKGEEVLPINRYNTKCAIWKHDQFIAYTDNNGCIGYLDITGRELLKPTYTHIGDFVDDYAIVAKTLYDYCHEEEREIENRFYGVINSSFEEIIPCVFNSIEYEKESGLFKTDVGYKTTDGRYITEVNGEKVLINAKYKYCKTFHEGYAIVVQVINDDEYYGLINMTSEEIIPPTFQWMKLLDVGVYKFKKDGLYGLVDLKGNIILTNKFHTIGNFENNLATTYIKTGENENEEELYLYGCIDSYGNEILSPDYEYMGKRSEGKMVIMKNNIWQLFDTTNLQIKIILNIAYLGICKDGLRRFNNGGFFNSTTLETNGGSWGYMNNNGEIVISPKYEKAYGFSEGIAAVKKNGKWGFIDINGIIVVPFEYDKIEQNFEDGLGRMVKDDKVFVFNKSGMLVDFYEIKIPNDDYYYSGGYDDEPSVYDNPYYNDNLDMDQQSIEFWNSL